MKSKTGQFSWNELVTDDEKASSTFYESLFGWKIKPFEHADKSKPDNGYKLFTVNSEQMPAGGMIQCPTPGVPAKWVPYVIVTNTDESLKKACALGAQVLLEPMDIPTVGRIAVIKDPRGAILGLHQLDENAA